MGFKIRKKVPRLFIVLVGILAISERTVRFSACAEGKSLNNKREVHDYDEHFGFGLMSDDHETSRKYQHNYHRYETVPSQILTNQGKNDITREVVITSTKDYLLGTNSSNNNGNENSNGGSKIKESSSSERGIDSYSSGKNEVQFIGCFDSWINNYQTYNNSRFDTTYTPTTCSTFCKNGGPEYQISLLKGGECICQTISSFNLEIMPNSSCDISCPYSQLATKKGPIKLENTCGGNRYYSAYCDLVGTRTCQTLVDKIRSKEINPDVEIDIPKARKNTAEEILFPCAVCINSDCSDNLITPFYDYFPKNDPASCVEFCSVPVTWAKKDEVKERAPTKYAALLWQFNGIDPSKMKPICQCLGLDDIKKYRDTDPSKCKTPCPGNSETFCGRSEDTPLHATIYCTTEWGNIPCSEEYPTTPTALTEIITSSTSTIKNPCDDATSDNADCISTPPTTTTTSPIDDETESTTPESISSSTSISASTTKEPSTSTQTDETSTDKISTEETQSPTTMPSMGTLCIEKCSQKEQNGRYWEVCAGSQGEKDCGNPDASGVVIWTCSYNGKFETDQPDYSGCHSPWVGDMEDQAKNINDTESALNYLSNLENVLTHSSHPTYFGHEIHNVTKILNAVVSKAGNVTTELKEFEKVSEKAVAVSKHLITSQDQWYQLSRDTRSALSTNLINSIEDTSLHLTSKVKISLESDSYEKSLSSESSQYFVTAGALLKRKNDYESDPFVFPSSNFKESFIKLPTNWKSAIPGDKIEFIGMYIDSQFANLIMPGQFKRLGVNPNDKGKQQTDDKVKVINGKLMSFTLASSSDDPNLTRSNQLQTSAGDNKLSVRFEGTGVQITFEHDLEAWGDTALDIRRKLHYGESPKAALGTSQCVFWDTDQLNWSTKGCKLVSNNRFQTVCECNHLTSFAVLMDVHNYTGQDLGLEVLTLILCSLSFLCLFVSVTMFSTIRGVQNPRTTITKNLAVCLLLGNTMVLLVLDRNYLNMSDGFCIASGIISHYVFLSAFIWMAIEGLHLYKMVVHVFDTENNPLNMYRLLSYGLPLIIVTVTVVVGYLKGDRPYGGDVVCWLDGHYIWSFMIPVALVVMGNFIILFIALKTAYQLQHNTKMPILQSRVRSFRTWIRGCFSLTILLGSTWLVGFFTLIPEAPGIAAAYIFTILNASQGIFIFVFHCLLNEKVRLVTRKRLGSYLPSWLSSSINSSGSVGNEASGLGKRAVSNMKSYNSDTSGNENSTVKSKSSKMDCGKIRAKLQFPKKDVVCMDETGGGTVAVISPLPRRGSFLRRRDSFGTVSSVDSFRPQCLGSLSDSSCSSSSSGSKTDNSLKILIADKTLNSKC